MLLSFSYHDSIFSGKSRLAITKKMLKQAEVVKEARHATSASVTTVGSSSPSYAPASKATVSSTTASLTSKPVATCEASVDPYLVESCENESFPSTPVSELLSAESETLRNSRKWSLSQRYFEYLNYKANFPKLISSDKTKLKAKVEEIFGLKEFKDVKLGEVNFKNCSGSPITDSYSINHGISLK